MSSVNGDTGARLRSPTPPQVAGLEVPPAATVEAPLSLRATALPKQETGNGPCRPPALPRDAEPLAVIIDTQQESATAGLDLSAVMSATARRAQALPND